MQDICTGNGGSETDPREVAQRSAPAGSHFRQEGGWEENVKGWYYPSRGARVTHSRSWNMVDLSGGNWGHGGDAA